MTIRGSSPQPDNSDLRYQQDLLNQRLEEHELAEQGELTEDEKRELEAEIARLEEDAGLS